MSYHIKKSKGLRSDSGRANAPSLANEMQQGNQGKKSEDGRAYVGAKMRQGGKKSGSKGSVGKSLGGVMQQGGSKHRG